MFERKMSDVEKAKYLGITLEEYHKRIKASEAKAEEERRKRISAHKAWDESRGSCQKCKVKLNGTKDTLCETCCTHDELECCEADYGGLEGLDISCKVCGKGFAADWVTALYKITRI